MAKTLSVEYAKSSDKFSIANFAWSRWNALFFRNDRNKFRWKGKEKYFHDRWFTLIFKKKKKLLDFAFILKLRYDLWQTNLKKFLRCLGFKLQILNGIFLSSIKDHEVWERHKWNMKKLEMTWRLTHEWFWVYTVFVSSVS